jgi:polyisoprenoid-binding protein YceI
VQDTNPVQRRPSGRARVAWGAAAIACLGLAIAPGHGAGADSLQLAPERTRIRFELGSTLHRIEGTARLLQGEVHFDEATGRATGRIAVDARSAETGNRTRDRKMHAEVLESERYAEIAFVPEALELVRHSEDRGDAVLVGRLRIHGSEHALRIPAQIERQGGEIRIAASFRIPYVAWGMRDVSNLLLRVDPDVEVHVEAFGRLRAEAAAPAEPGSAPP